jgi:hypothetical protein
MNQKMFVNPLFKWVMLFFFTLLICVSANSQNRRATHIGGKVTDANGPVARATVTEKGTSNATATDNDGNFSINVTNGNVVLVFTSIGFKWQAQKDGLQCLQEQKPY